MSNIIDAPIFHKELICFSVKENNELSVKKINQYEISDKIILPNILLSSISNSENYVHFRLINKNNSLEAYAGVGDFNSSKDICFIPSWIMDFLKIKGGDKISCESVFLPKAEKIVAQIPKSIQNYKSVLEYILKDHTALFMTKVIKINIFNKSFDIIINLLTPDYAVSILDCDPFIDVEFY